MMGITARATAPAEATSLEANDTTLTPDLLMLMTVARAVAL